LAHEQSVGSIEQKTLIFYEDNITAVLVDMDGNQEVYVPVRPLCDYLGLNWSGQRQRIYRDTILNEVSSECVIHSQGQGRSMLCLPLDYLNGWLFSVSAERVKDEIRGSLLRYQRECYRVLADAFRSAGVIANAPSALIQVREIGLAIVRMAEEQMAFDRRLGAAEGELRVVTERLTAVSRHKQCKAVRALLN
jgi:hypothetical protein